MLNAIRRARKAKTPAQRAEHVRAAQDQLRSISPRQHPELVSAIQAKLLATRGRTKPSLTRDNPTHSEHP